MEGNSTTPKNCVLTNFLHERSVIFPSGFLTNMILNFAQEWYLYVEAALRAEEPKNTGSSLRTLVDFAFHVVIFSMFQWQ